jgi:regulation of enolase protein 1 (concanavalin A-like superfamily)
VQIDFSPGQWINQPQKHTVSSTFVEIVTEPKTDFWQRSYYGFRNDNAPALLLPSSENFTFTARAAFDYKQRFDQCGLIIYIDSENWFKASIEYENENFSRLGSVVTNNGYSDWATTNIPGTTSMWYRLSRRGPDFLIESCTDSQNFGQMRIFHLHCLGETTTEMGKRNPPLPAKQSINFGLYACSPLDSSFKAKFSNFKMEGCAWRAHSA